ncbi:site-2 protease family protein [candidate division KSB1 bacterium]|nr:site-2 protease family protein [candidate division KSB1 bacterium]
MTTFLTGWLGNGNWQAGLWYGGAIISILLAHEMGHYIMCKKYGIRATLPFFIPFINPFGTLGAVIKMESRIPSRKALFDVAVAGPLAGLFLTMPAIYFGIQLSEIIESHPAATSEMIYLGESFLFAKLSNLAIGVLPENQDVVLHPLAYAGWAGLFITALNLLPIGQLDGGHIVYALIGKGHKFVATAALLAFGGIAIFIFHGWILLLIMLIWLGYKHPPTLDETPVDTKRIIIGLLTILLFLVSFTPEPFKVAAF